MEEFVQIAWLGRAGAKWCRVDLPQPHVSKRQEWWHHLPGIWGILLQALMMPWAADSLHPWGLFNPWTTIPSRPMAARDTETSNSPWGLSQER